MYVMYIYICICMYIYVYNINIMGDALMRATLTVL